MRHPVSVTFAASNDELFAGKVHILDSEPQTFQQPKPTSVQQCGHEPFGPTKTAEYCPHFIPRQNNRQPPGPLCIDQAGQLAKIPGQYSTVQKQQGTQRLVLG